MSQMQFALEFQQQIDLSFIYARVCHQDKCLLNNDDVISTKVHASLPVYFILISR